MRLPTGSRERGTYLGGHDAARIAGVMPWGAGVADTYASVVLKNRTPMTPRMLRGLLFEPGLAAWVAEQRGIPHERDVFLMDDDVPFFAGSLDAVETGGEVMHEFTTTTTRSSFMWGIPGTEDCAKHKWVQAQWYMGLDARLREAHVWCFLVDGDELPMHYIIPRNEVAIGELRTRSEAFWYDHILPRVPPLGSAFDASANEALDKLYPKSSGPIIDASAELVDAAQQYADARAAMKQHEEAKESAAARLKAALGEHQGARWPGGSVSWKDRPLGEKIHWESVAHELALRCKVDGAVFNGLVAENKYEARSVRALRVSVKDV